MQDFYRQQADWLKSWQESQATHMKQYANWGEQWMASVQKSFGSELPKGWPWAPEELESQYGELGKRFNEMASGWSGMVLPEALKFMNISYLEEFCKTWASSVQWPGADPDKTEEACQKGADLLRSYLEKNTEYFSSFTNSFTSHINRAYGMFLGTWGREQGSLNNIIKGYEDFFNRFLQSASSQYTEQLTGVFDKWAAEIEKHLSAPKLGITREAAHDFSQLLVISQNYMQAYLKLWRLMEATGRRAGQRFQGRLREAALENKPVLNFTDLCALWSIENETVFTEVMGTEEFAKLQGDFVDATHRLKIQWDKLVERALDPTPLALKRDLDLAIAEITQLRRDVRSLQRELRERGKEQPSASGDTSRGKGEGRPPVAGNMDEEEKKGQDKREPEQKRALDAAAPPLGDTGTAEAPGALDQAQPTKPTARKSKAARHARHVQE